MKVVAINGSPRKDGNCAQMLEVLGKVLEGEKFLTYQQRGPWWRVRKADGTTGYMFRKYIRVVEGGVRAPGPAIAGGAGCGSRRLRGHAPSASARSAASSEPDSAARTVPSRSSTDPVPSPSRP